MEEPTLPGFDAGLREAIIDDEFMVPAPPPKRYELHGENREGIGQLQADVVAWSWDGGVWWMTGADGSITGYHFRHYFWLSVREQVDV